MPTRYIGGNQGTTQIRSTNQNFDVYDCTRATAGGPDNQAIFNVQIGPPKITEPFFIENSQQDNVEIFGGINYGHLPRTQHRANNSGGLYQLQNSAGIKVTGDVNYHIHDWIFGENEDWKASTGHNWDCIRANITNAYDTNLLLERIWARGCRDDFLERDAPNAETESPNAAGGTCTVNDVLIEGACGGFSCTNNSRDHTFFLNNTALMCTNFYEDLGEGDQYRTFGPMFKPDGSGQRGPAWVVNNSVFAYETWDGAAMNLNGQPGEGRVKEAFRRWTGTNNFMCVLAAGTLPSGFPSLPAGMTLLTGQAARDKWTAKRAELIEIITDGTVVEPPIVVNTIVNKSIMSINTSTGVLTTNTADDISSQTFVVEAANAGGSTTGNLTVSVA